MVGELRRAVFDANVLVPGDPHLTTLQRPGLTVMTPRSFLDALNSLESASSAGLSEPYRGRATGHYAAAGASEALLEESAWSRLATISTVQRVVPSVDCRWRLWSGPST